MLVVVQTLVLSAGIWSWLTLCCVDGAIVLSPATVCYPGRVYECGQRGRRRLHVPVLSRGRHHALHRQPSPLLMETSRGIVCYYQLASYNVKPSKSSKLRFKRAVFVQGYTVMFLLVVLTVGIFRFDYRLLNQIK